MTYEEFLKTKANLAKRNAVCKERVAEAKPHLAEKLTTLRQAETECRKILLDMIEGTGGELKFKDGGTSYVVSADDDHRITVCVDSATSTSDPAETINIDGMSTIGDLQLVNLQIAMVDKFIKDANKTIDALMGISYRETEKAEHLIAEACGEKDESYW